jgi:hypothetical protein
MATVATRCPRARKATLDSPHFRCAEEASRTLWHAPRGVKKKKKKKKKRQGGDENPQDR